LDQLQRVHGLARDFFARLTQKTLDPFVAADAVRRLLRAGDGTRALPAHVDHRQRDPIKDDQPVFTVFDPSPIARISSGIAPERSRRTIRLPNSLG
jgi:hypothetical protein